MQFSGEFAADDLVTFRRVSRSRWHWLGLGATHLEGLLELAAVAAVTIMSLWRRRSTSWSDLGFMWGVVAIGVTWNRLTTPRRRKKELARVNANTPDTISLDATALVMRRRGYEIRTVPWDQFTRRHQRRRVMALDASDGLEPVVFSTSRCRSWSANTCEVS